MKDGLLTSNEVVVHLMALSRQLDEAVEALKKAESDAVRLRHAADMAESMAFVRTDGTAEFRKHTARIEAGPAEEAALVAEAAVRYLRHRISAISLRIEVGRSYGAAVRAELRTLGIQEG